MSPPPCPLPLLSPSPSVPSPHVLSTAKNDDCGMTVTSSILRLIDAVDAVRASQAVVGAELRTNVVEEIKDYQKAHYRKNVVGKIKEAAIIVTIPTNISQIVLGWISGQVGDWTIKKKGSSISTLNEKTFISL